MSLPRPDTLRQHCCLSGINDSRSTSFSHQVPFQVIQTLCLNMVTPELRRLVPAYFLSR
jgi:hypothetical protein